VPAHDIAVSAKTPAVHVKSSDPEQAIFFLYMFRLSDGISTAIAGGSVALELAGYSTYASSRLGRAFSRQPSVM
jgi:hypothetical protein